MEQHKCQRLLKKQVQSDEDFSSGGGQAMELAPQLCACWGTFTSMNGTVQRLTPWSEIEIIASLSDGRAGASSTYSNPECPMVVLPKYQSSACGKGLASLCASYFSKCLHRVSPREFRNSSALARLLVPKPSKRF